MAVALVKAGTAVTTLSPSFGQATTAGNLLIACLASNSAGSSSPFSTSAPGWELAVAWGVAYSWAAVYYKPGCGAGETAPVFTDSGSGPDASVLAEFSGAATASPLDSSGTSSTATATNAAPDAGAGDLIVAIATDTNYDGAALAASSMHDSSGASVTPASLGGVYNSSSGWDYGWAYGIAGPAGASNDTVTFNYTTYSAIVSFKVPALAVTTTSLPAAVIGVAYSQTLADNGGGTGSGYTWSISSGSLPGWASLASSTGVISGTPSGGGGPVTFTVKVTDSGSNTATQQLTIDTVSYGGASLSPSVPAVAVPGFVPAAVSAVPSVTAHAGLASAAGVAQQSGPPRVTATAVLASGTGTAASPAARLLVPARLAAGAGTALAAEFGRVIAGLGGTPGPGWFIDQYGSPRLWVASETWSLPANAGAWNGTGGGTWQQDFDNFFSERAAQGLTVMMTDLVGNTEQGGPYNNGNTWDNVAPFNTGQDPTSGLNSTYWTRYDYMLNSALAQGITVALVFNQYDWATGCCYNGWTDAQCQAYGAALGARYKGQPNLIWLFGNDGYPGALDSYWDYIMTGLSGAGDTHMIGVWWSAEYTSRYETDNNTAAAFGEANSLFNFGYTYNAGYWVCEYAYSENLAPDDQAHLLPVIWGDGYFYQSGSSGTYYDPDDRAMRQESWWWLTDGGRGILSEAENVYQWASTSPAAVTGDWFFANNLPVIVRTYTGLGKWWELLPDLSSSFVTSGRGTRVAGLASGGGGGSYENSTANSWVTASITPDGTLAVAYLPNHTTITVNTSLLSGTWTASWIDPISGAVTSAGTSGTYNSTAKGTNSQGDPDWVLAFQTEAAPAVTATAGLATGSGTAQAPVPALSVPVALAAGTGTAQQPAPATGIPAVLAAAPGTAQAPAAEIAIPAGLASGTGTAQQVPPAATAPAGLAAGTGTAQQPAASLSPAAGLAQATGTAQQPLTTSPEPASGSGVAQSPSAALSIPAGLAAAAGTAQQAPSALTVPAAAATAAGTAQQPTVSTTASVTASAGLAAATGTAGQPAPATVVPAQPAAAQGTAQAAGITPAAPAGLASGTGTAQAPAVALTVPASLATGQGTARQASVTTTGAVTATAQIATGTGAAQAPVPALTVLADPADLAAGSGTAQAPAPALTAPAGLAASPGTAQQAAPCTAPAAGLPSGSGTASPPAPSVTVPAVLATAAGAAQQPTPATAPVAGLATGTGTAQQPQASLAGIAASLAAASGIAQAPSAETSTPAGLATAAGTAGQAPAALTVPAGLATGTGTSQQASVTTSAGTTANAGLALASGTAPAAITSLTVTAGLATATGAAAQPAIVVQVGVTPASGSGTAPAVITLIATPAGLAIGAGTAQQPVAVFPFVVTAGLATAAGIAQQASIPAAAVPPVLAFGVPYLAWATGGPQTAWETDVPYTAGATGEPYT